MRKIALFVMCASSVSVYSMTESEVQRALYIHNQTKQPASASSDSTHERCSGTPRKNFKRKIVDGLKAFGIGYQHVYMNVCIHGHPEFWDYEILQDGE